MGVSIGISYESVPHATSTIAVAAATSAAPSSLLFLALTRPVIDFLEQLVVLTNMGVVRLDLERPLVRLPRLVELPFVFIGNRKVIEGGRIARIDLGGPFPPVDRFAPEAALRDVDAEIDLL